MSPRIQDGREFAAETNLLLEPDPQLRILVDMSIRVQAMESTVLVLHTVQVQAGQER